MNLNFPFFQVNLQWQNALCNYRPRFRKSYYVNFPDFQKGGPTAVGGWRLCMSRRPELQREVLGTPLEKIGYLRVARCDFLASEEGISQLIRSPFCLRCQSNAGRPERSYSGTKGRGGPGAPPLFPPLTSARNITMWSSVWSLQKLLYLLSVMWFMTKNFKGHFWEGTLSVHSVWPKHLGLPTCKVQFNNIAIIFPFQYRIHLSFNSKRLYGVLKYLFHTQESWIVLFCSLHLTSIKACSLIEWVIGHCLKRRWVKVQFLVC